MHVLNIEEIQKILPQRFPFLMIDKVIELDPGRKIVAVKNVTINEGFFAGHFPTRPILPGVLIIESMAQAAIILFYSKKEKVAADKKMLYYLGSVKVRFLSPVFPGDQLKVEIEPVKIFSGTGIVKVSAKVQEKEVARGELAFSAKEDK